MVCRSSTLVYRRRIYLELHIAGLCRVESYTWLCRIGVVHNWFTGVKVKFAGIRIILSFTLLRCADDWKELYLTSQKWCLQVATKKLSCTLLHLLLVSAEWRERSFSRPGVNNLPCQTQPPSQGGLPRFKLTFHKCTFAFHSTAFLRMYSFFSWPWNWRYLMHQIVKHINNTLDSSI